MPGDDGIKAVGIVMELLPNTTVRVRLPNGHEILAHRSRQVRADGRQIADGDRVRVEMSPFDMSIGRITGKETE
ncbi:MAG TPA: translation initiation factor IF-1 [Roseimicrobium sp.]|nr:translation initiation factor IF-1 [Roseimicrobium sp.]